ncbi:hypothetical protein Glove_490g66 [Diversispora epigaea]|uniref:MULE transposase domain-containing protein n=1 Tax=Diversispora epigaea TaxID=1348612 RepID=A0A397GMU2_9GLOM|nr:hypothetical protein Glove_490g66 [Diversispora epigaea]
MNSATTYDVPPSFSNFDATHAIMIFKQDNSLQSNMFSPNSSNFIQHLYFHFSQLPLNFSHYPYSQSFYPNYQQLTTSSKEIPTIYEFLKALDSKFNTPGTYTQFEKAFVDEEITKIFENSLSSDFDMEKIKVLCKKKKSRAIQKDDLTLVLGIVINIREVTFVRRRFIKVPLNLYPNILIKSSTDKDNSTNIDAKNIVLPFLKNSALKLSNCSLIILSSSIFMKLIPINIREVTFVRRRFIKVPLNLYPNILIKSSTDKDNSTNIDAKNIVLPFLKNSALKLSNCSLIILSSSIFMKLIPSLPFNNTNNNTTETTLYQGKIFDTWQQAFDIIKGWAKYKGFKVKYDRVERNPDGTFRKRTIKCEHQGTYIAKSNEKQTTTKRIGCTWYINLSEPQSKNPFKHVYVTTFHDTHSHILNPTTDNMHPRVIMTDSDPAVHAAIRSTFVTTYPMHCTFHISQNLIKKLQKLLGKKFHEFSSWFYDTRNTLHKPIFESKWKNLISKYPEAQEYLNNLYNTKEAWAHPWTCRQFTAGLHASSPVESINAWIKSYIFNSNISLCELANIIDKRQFSEDKNYQLILWKAAIPCISTHVSTSAFMFSSIDKKLEEYLPPAILELQRNEIRHMREQISWKTLEYLQRLSRYTHDYINTVPIYKTHLLACVNRSLENTGVSSKTKLDIVSETD